MEKSGSGVGGGVVLYMCFGLRERGASANSSLTPSLQSFSFLISYLRFLDGVAVSKGHDIRSPTTAVHYHRGDFLLD